MGLVGDGRAARAHEILAGAIPGRVEQEGDLIRITSDQGAHVLVDVLRRLGDGLEPDTLTVREPSMDDVFLALTGRHAESVEEQDEAEMRSRAGQEGSA
jgi:hypothetical protein